MDKLTPVFSGAGVLPPSVTAGGVSSSGGGVTDAVSFSDTGVAGGVSSSGDDVTGAASFVPGAGGLFPAAPHSLGRLGGIVKIPITNISRLAVISTDQISSLNQSSLIRSSWRVRFVQSFISILLFMAGFNNSAMMPPKLR